MVHHIDNGFDRVTAELSDDPEVNSILSEKVMSSRKATEATLTISAMTGLPPPKASTALHMGVAMGIGLVLEMLNEREITDVNPCSGSPSIN